MAPYSPPTPVPTTSARAFYPPASRLENVIAIVCFVSIPVVVCIAFAVLRYRRKPKAKAPDIPRYYGREYDVRSRSNNANELSLPPYPGPAATNPPNRRMPESPSAANLSRSTIRVVCEIVYDDSHPLANYASLYNQPPPTPTILPSAPPPGIPNISPLPSLAGSFPAHRSISSIPTDYCASLSSLPSLRRARDLSPYGFETAESSFANFAGFHHRDGGPDANANPSSNVQHTAVMSSDHGSVAPAASERCDSGFHETVSDGSRYADSVMSDTSCLFMENSRVPRRIKQPVEDEEIEIEIEENSAFIYHGSPAMSVDGREAEVSSDQEVTDPVSGDSSEPEIGLMNEGESLGMADEYHAGAIDDDDLYGAD